MAQRIVVDTSVLTKWVNQANENHTEQADELLLDAKENRIELIAPELAKYELGNVLLKGKKLSPPEAYISLGTAYALPITFFSESEEGSHDTYDLAHEMGITYYDASFLSLAKHQGATLITENIKHQKKDHGVKVVALAEYESKNDK